MTVSALSLSLFLTASTSCSGSKLATIWVTSSLNVAAEIFLCYLPTEAEVGLVEALAVEAAGLVEVEAGPVEAGPVEVEAGLVEALPVEAGLELARYQLRLASADRKGRPFQVFRCRLRREVS